MGNSHALESVLRLIFQWCYRFTDANAMLLPTANVCVTFLWLRMRPLYRRVKVDLEANPDAYSAEYLRWWSNGGAPEILVLDDRRGTR